MDLTTSYPASVRETMHGIVQLKRTIDKGKAFAAGTNGEYNYDCPMDKAVFGFLGLNHAALLDVIKKANSQDEIVAYVKPFVDKKSAAEINAFNEEFVKHAPAPGSDAEKYFLATRNQIGANRTDITTWADLLDLEEKRTVPERVHA